VSRQLPGGTGTVSEGADELGGDGGEDAVEGGATVVSGEEDVVVGDVVVVAPDDEVVAISGDVDDGGTVPSVVVVVVQVPSVAPGWEPRNS
jgi:hypothetical protein